MKRKRILCALLTLTAVLALLCIPAFAAGTGDEAKQIYGDVIVPDVIWDYSTGKFVGPDETEIRFGDIGFLPRPRSVYTSPEIIDIVPNTLDNVALAAKPTAKPVIPKPAIREDTE